MKCKMFKLFIHLVNLLVFLSGLFVLITGARVYKKTFKAKPTDISLNKELYDVRLKQLEGYKHQKMLVESSKNKYNVEMMHIKSNYESNNVIILIHGLYANYYDLLPTAFRYLNDGYNVILYNQRQTGETGGKSNSFGYYERYDLEEIATIARRIYPSGKIGVHGFSMGAATAIMHSELNETSNLVDFYIFDAPYHTMKSAVELAAKRGKDTKIPPWFVTFSGDAFLKLKERISYEDIVPSNVIHKSTRPILLIHGDLDDWTLPAGSKQLYEKISHDKKRLVTFPLEKHCSAHVNSEDKYFEAIHQFIQEFS